MTQPDSDRTLRVLIVDDERLARRALRTLLAAHPDVEVVGEASKVEEAAVLVQRERPDVVLLDVQMRGETGFDLLDLLDAPCHVIFVTAFDAYAVRAFEVNALDYLLKPVEPARLAEALKRARQRTPSLSEASSATTTRDIGLPFRYDDLFFHEDGRRSQFIRIRDIVFIQAAANYTELHLQNGKMVLVLRPLAQWEARLPDAYFVRIHRSTIVNVAFVRRVERAFNYTYEVHLRDGSEPLVMSRRRASVLKALLG